MLGLARNFTSVVGRQKSWQHKDWTLAQHS